jgi:hypothetical protein
MEEESSDLWCDLMRTCCCSTVSSLVVVVVVVVRLDQHSSVVAIGNGELRCGVVERVKYLDL